MAIENPIIEEFKRSFEIELPHASTMDGYLDAILPDIRPYSEDLREEQFFMNKRWLEISDEEDFHETILHIFQDEGQYMIVMDGDISMGGWSILDNSNNLILETGAHEMYELVFLNNDFLVIKKHGNQQRLNRKKYRIFGREGKVRNLEWRDVIESMYNLHRESDDFSSTVIIAVVVVAIVILFSIF